MLKLTELQVSSRNHPIGLDEQPVFSWKMVSDIPDTIQTAYRVRVGSWDTGRVESGDSLFVPYAGPALQPRTAYRVQVEVWDNHGQTACAETGVETGLRGPDGFAAQWIADPFEGEHPLPVFETEFAIDTPVTTARLYIMAHGIYEAELDGAKLGDAWFAPGWTSYHKRLQYQTIPVDTARLTPGRHTLRVTVANGWYKGALGFVPSPNHYGDRAALLAMLCLDGRTVATGEGWRVTTGPVQRAEFYYGEDYDAAAPAAAPRPPLLPGLDKQNLIAQEDEPVRCVQMLPVVKDFLAPNGEWVLDFGQNITGVVHAKLDLPAGAQVRLRHAESLDENGNFYTGNLSFAKSEDTFRSAGQPAEYLPRFTCHGFRYLCVEGLPESQRDPAAFTACVLTTDLRRTGQFRCSDERVNQLQSNIQWSQQDNFLEVPTDCPQRSERLGWTGDIRAYGCTALFNSDAALFLKKWLRDLAADQGEDGAVPYVVPDVLDAPGQPVSTASFWGDSAVVLPWEIYMASDNHWLPQAPFVPGCDTKGNVTEESLAQAAAAAKSAKVAVVCAGLPDLYESEGFDRETMAMPEGHVRLIETVAAANPNTVVVVFCGSAVETPWIDRVKAVLYMGLPGQAGGEAAAALLTGTANPGGKLTETWPLSYDQVPSRDTFGQKVTRYKEGLYVGYRYYDTAGVPVRYPFGYGLSYTRFAYSDLTVENRTVRVAVTNIGDCPGAEVAQLYIAPPRTGPYRPAKELKGFARVYLTPRREPHR